MYYQDLNGKAPINIHQGGISDAVISSFPSLKFHYTATDIKQQNYQAHNWIPATPLFDDRVTEPNLSKISVHHNGHTYLTIR